MFRNRIKLNGSAYLAETLLSRHPSNEQKIGIFMLSVEIFNVKIIFLNIFAKKVDK